MKRRWLVCLLIPAVLLPIVVVSGGCQAVGMAAYVLNPPVDKARYVPPKAPMLVLVENKANPGMYVLATDQLTGYIIDDLQAYEVCPIVPQSKLTALQDANPNMEKMTISQIGQAVGASQVLYVDIRKISVGAIAGVPASGRAEALVRVVDVKTGTTAFPSTAESLPVVFDTPLIDDVQNPDMVRARETMLHAAGTTIGRMFHDFSPG